MSLKKDEILQEIAWAAGITKEQAEKAIKSLSDTVKKGLSDSNGNPSVGASQKIEGIGTYEVRDTKAKTGANPQVSAARKLVEKAAAGEAVDATKLAKAQELMAKVESGEVKAELEIPAAQKLGFRPEKAMKDWVNPNDEDDAE